MPNALLDEAPEAEITPVLLEFGVKPTVDALDAIRADVWLYRHGQPNSPEGGRIKAEVRSAFYGETDDWKARIFERTVDVYRLTLAGLSRSQPVMSGSAAAQLESPIDRHPILHWKERARWASRNRMRNGSAPLTT